MKRTLDDLERDTLRWVKHHYWYYNGDGKDLPKDEKFYDYNIILSDYKKLLQRVGELLPFESELNLTAYRSLPLLFALKKILNCEFDPSSATNLHYRMQVISVFYAVLVNIDCS